MNEELRYEKSNTYPMLARQQSPFYTCERERLHLSNTVMDDLIPLQIRASANPVL
jgi:hypothetical protein